MTIAELTPGSELRSSSDRCPPARRAIGPPDTVMDRPALGVALPVGRKVRNGLSDTPGVCAAVGVDAANRLTATSTRHDEQRTTIRLRKRMRRRNASSLPDTPPSSPGATK